MAKGRIIAAAALTAVAALFSLAGCDTPLDEWARDLFHGEQEPDPLYSPGTIPSTAITYTVVAAAPEGTPSGTATEPKIHMGNTGLDPVITIDDGAINTYDNTYFNYDLLKALLGSSGMEADDTFTFDGDGRISAINKAATGSSIHLILGGFLPPGAFAKQVVFTGNSSCGVNISGLQPVFAPLPVGPGGTFVLTNSSILFKLKPNTGRNAMYNFYGVEVTPKGFDSEYVIAEMRTPNEVDLSPFRLSPSPVVVVLGTNNPDPAKNSKYNPALVRLNLIGEPALVTNHKGPGPGPGPVNGVNFVVNVNQNSPGVSGVTVTADVATTVKIDWPGTTPAGDWPVNPWVRIIGPIDFTITAVDDPVSSVAYTYDPATGKMYTEGCEYLLTTNGAAHPPASVIDAANASKSSFGTVTPGSGVTITGTDLKPGNFSLEKLNNTAVPREFTVKTNTSGTFATLLDDEITLDIDGGVTTLSYKLSGTAAQKDVTLNPTLDAALIALLTNGAGLDNGDQFTVTGGKIVGIKNTGNPDTITALPAAWIGAALKVTGHGTDLLTLPALSTDLTIELTIEAGKVTTGAIAGSVKIGDGTNTFTGTVTVPNASTGITLAAANALPGVTLTASTNDALNGFAVNAGDVTGGDITVGTVTVISGSHTFGNITGAFTLTEGTATTGTVSGTATLGASAGASNVTSLTGIVVNSSNQVTGGTAEANITVTSGAHTFGTITGNAAVNGSSANGTFGNITGNFTLTEGTATTGTVGGTATLGAGAGASGVTSLTSIVANSSNQVTGGAAAADITVTSGTHTFGNITGNATVNGPSASTFGTFGTVSGDFTLTQGKATTGAITGTAKMGSATITAPAAPTLTNVVVAADGAVTGGTSTATKITDSAADDSTDIAALFGLNSSAAMELTLTASAVDLSGATVPNTMKLIIPDGTAAGVASGTFTLNGALDLEDVLTLAAGAAITIPSTGTITASGSGKVVVNAGTQLVTVAALTPTAALPVELGTDITTSAALAIGANVTVTVPNGKTLTSAQTVTGTGTLTTSGSGKVVANADSTLRTVIALTTPALAVELGTNITTGAGLAISDKVTVTVPDGKTLTISAGQTVSYTGTETGRLTTSGSGKVVVNSDITLRTVAALPTPALAVELGTDFTTDASPAIGDKVTVTVPNGKTLTIAAGHTVSCTGTGILTTSGSGKVVVEDDPALTNVAALPMPALAVELGTNITRSVALAIGANVTVTVPSGLVLELPAGTPTSGPGTLATGGGSITITEGLSGLTTTAPVTGDDFALAVPALTADNADLMKWVKATNLDEAANAHTGYTVTSGTTLAGPTTPTSITPQPPVDFGSRVNATHFTLSLGADGTSVDITDSAWGGGNNASGDLKLYFAGLHIVNRNVKFPVRSSFYIYLITTRQP